MYQVYRWLKKSRVTDETIRDKASATGWQWFWQSLQGRVGVHKNSHACQAWLLVRCAGCGLCGELPAKWPLVAAGNQSVKEKLCCFFESSMWVLYSQSGIGPFRRLRHYKCSVPYSVRRLWVPSSLLTLAKPLPPASAPFMHLSGVLCAASRPGPVVSIKDIEKKLDPRSLASRNILWWHMTHYLSFRWGEISSNYLEE